MKFKTLCLLFVGFYLLVGVWLYFSPSSVVAQNVMLVGCTGLLFWMLVRWGRQRK